RCQRANGSHHIGESSPLESILRHIVLLSVNDTAFLYPSQGTTACVELDRQGHQREQCKYTVTSNDHQQRGVEGEQSFNGEGPEHHHHKDDVDEFRSLVLNGHHGRPELEHAIRRAVLHGMATRVGRYGSSWSVSPMIHFFT